MAVMRSASKTEKPLTVLIDEELRTNLEGRAAKEDLNMSQLTRKALRRYLDSGPLAS